MSEPIIQLDDVHLTLTSRAGPVHILRGVSLDIPVGQPAAIVGPSGSGKTSLLMVMAGLERASSGAVTVGGNALTRLSEDELAVLRGAEMGIIFQSFHLVPTMTALENVALPMELAGDPKAFDAARDLLHEVGLADRVDHFPAQLSGESSSASPLPAPWSANRASFSPTSRPAISMAAPAGRSSIFFLDCVNAATQPSSS